MELCGQVTRVVQLVAFSCYDSPAMNKTEDRLKGLHLGSSQRLFFSISRFQAATVWVKVIIVESTVCVGVQESRGLKIVNLLLLRDRSYRIIWCHRMCSLRVEII